jgi:hypothetical protein
LRKRGKNCIIFPCAQYRATDRGDAGRRIATPSLSV